MPSLDTILNEFLLQICDELSLYSLCSLRATNNHLYDLPTPRYIASIYDHCEKTGEVPLYHACTSLNIPFAVRLICHGANVSEGPVYAFIDLQEVHPETPLHWRSKRAGEEGALAIARALLQAGAEVNEKSLASGETPLLQAIRAVQYHRLVPMVQLLLEWAADVNARQRSGFTPLHFCATSWEIKGTSNCTSLHCAVQLWKRLPFVIRDLYGN
jgi:ankyrin repeat protein